MKSLIRLASVVAVAPPRVLALAPRRLMVAAVPADIRTRGTIRVGSQHPVPPVEFREPGKTEVIPGRLHLLDEVAKRLTLKIEYIQAEYAALMPPDAIRTDPPSTPGISAAYSPWMYSIFKPSRFATSSNRSRLTPITSVLPGSRNSTGGTLCCEPTRMVPRVLILAGTAAITSAGIAFGACASSVGGDATATTASEADQYFMWISFAMGSFEVDNQRVSAVLPGTLDGLADRRGDRARPPCTSRGRDRRIPSEALFVQTVRNVLPIEIRRPHRNAGPVIRYVQQS